MTDLFSTDLTIALLVRWTFQVPLRSTSIQRGKHFLAQLKGDNGTLKFAVCYAVLQSKHDGRALAVVVLHDQDVYGFTICHHCYSICARTLSTAFSSAFLSQGYLSAKKSRQRFGKGSAIILRCARCGEVRRSQTPILPAGSLGHAPSPVSSSSV